MFAKEAVKIKQLLNEYCAAIHHISNTAVYGLSFWIKR